MVSASWVPVVPALQFGFIYIFSDVWYVNFLKRSSDRLTEQFRSTLHGSSRTMQSLHSNVCYKKLSLLPELPYLPRRDNVLPIRSHTDFQF